MRLHVQHFSRYEYSVPVSLGPHLLRLVPQGPDLTTVAHEIDILPMPTSRVRVTDAHGNDVIRVEFSGVTTKLWIESRFEVVTSPTQLDHVQGLARLPWACPEPNAFDGTLEIAAFASDLVERADGDVFGFLDALSQTLHRRTDRHIRWEGSARSPIETLRSASGACRDLTLLFMECCRLVGITARFVSGYQSTADTPDGQRHLHAWPEVLLSGAWYAWDPTHGQRARDGHVRLCAAPTQNETMPVEGGYSFIGSELTSTLDYGVRIEAAAGP